MVRSSSLKLTTPQCLDRNDFGAVYINYTHVQDKVAAFYTTFHGELYVVGSSIMDLRDVRSWSTSLTVEALRNARARVFTLVIRAMQEPCPASQTLLLY